MQMPSPRPRLSVFLFGIAALALSSWVAAEPPSRAARLSDIRGTVSFSPAGQSDWVRAVTNRPLTTGDRLWVDANSRAELQVGGAAIRLGGATSVTLLNIDDRIVQVQLSQGALKARVRRMGPNQTLEVDTPNLAFSLGRPGEFRINVDPNEDATAVMMQSGRAEVYGEGESYAVNPKQGYRFYGTGLGDYERVVASRDDDLDRWARERDRRGDNSQSARYVSSEVVGYEDLDANGTWRTDPNYGNVWTPTRVAGGWTPYRDGHWAWIDPWGWTWVDDAPWGYAVSHYGRWANIRGSWSWVPGPPREQAVYAPALVAFVGGQNSRDTPSVGGTIAALVGWFPLAPREVYQPSYPVSRGYFDNINRSNAVIAPATITNVYNITNTTNTTTNNTTIINNSPTVTKVVYANQQVTGAVVAVPAQAFAQSQPVAKAAVPVSKEAAIGAPVAHVAAVAPVQQSVHGGAPASGAKPPAVERAVVARTAPPPPPVAFALQQQQLAAKPGTPIDQAQRNQLKPAITSAPKVSVVTTAQAPAPSAPPPATPPAAKSPDARRADAAKADAAKPDAVKSDAAKGDTAKMDAAKAEAAKAAATRSDAARVDAAKADAAKADAARAEAAKAEAAKAAAAKSDTARVDAAKAEAAKAAAAKSDAARVDAAKAEGARADAAKAAAAKSDAARVDAAKADAARADAAKAEAAKAALAKAEASRVDAAKAEASRADAAKAEAAKAAAARVDAAKAEAARADAAKAAAAKSDAARVDAAKADAARADAAKAEAAKAAAARAEASRADAVKADAARAASANADAAKAAKVKAEADAKKAEDEKKAAEEVRKH
jgi:hypothetical protein